MNVIEAAESLGIPPQTLRIWILDGRVVPTRRGSIGRTNGHDLSPQLVERIRRWADRRAKVNSEVVR